MNISDQTNVTKNDFRRVVNPDLVRLWLLRMLVPLEGYKEFVRDHELGCDQIARAVGIEEYVGSAESSMPFDRRKIIEALRQRWHEAEAQGLLSEPWSLPENRLWKLGAALNLKEVEIKVLHFIWAMKEEGLIKKGASQVGWAKDAIEEFVAGCLDLDTESVRDSLNLDGILAQSGILTRAIDGIPFPDNMRLIDLLQDGLRHEHVNTLDIFRSRIIPAPIPKLTREHYPHFEHDIQALIAYLTHAVVARKCGVNILIYGPPGTGKTEFVRMLAAALQFSLYEIAAETRFGHPLNDVDRFRGYRLAQVLLGDCGKTLILFDEAERAFHRKPSVVLGARDDSGEAKGWQVKQFESNPVPAFWLSNSIREVDPAIIRRFDYVIAMNTPPRSVRARILEEYLADIPVSEAWKRQIAEHEQLAPAVVERATKVVHAIKGKMSQEEMTHTLDRLLGNTLEAMGLSRSARPVVDLATGYRLDVLNTDCDVIAIRDGLLAHREGRICLYGPPGTGKTAFARYLAEALDRPLLVQRASDIISPFLGQTEQKIAHMFLRAKQDNAVLLLDEADSFLQDRRGAQRSWEITEVNEMLTQMESFDGMFIASTNLMESLDPAALRRFDLKVHFGYLKPEQSWLLFLDTLHRLGLDENPSLQKQIEKFDCLTPGDFATVLRQSRLTKIVDAKTLYERLAAEYMAKPQARKHPVGFVS